MPTIPSWLVAATSPTGPGGAIAAQSSAEEPNVLLYLLGGGSLVTILGMLGSALKGWYTGHGKEVIRREASLVEQRDTAWEERDGERDKREKSEAEARARVARAERNLRRVESHAGQLIYLLHKNGVPADQIPAYPHIEQDTTE